MTRSSVAAVVFATLACSAIHQSAFAQLKATLFVSGLSSPVGVYQDPLHANVQFVLQQGGRIRVIKDQVLQAQDFLNLTASIVSGGERGLLGLAFAPDYATSRRFFVNFTNTNGDTVIARFLRSAVDSLQADPSTRFDLKWPSGDRFIAQPFTNHKGGCLMFGPEGFLYIGMGDGGSGDDPFNNAQNPLTLLGKMLRIDVSVQDNDDKGYKIPTSNPFFGDGNVLQEIWSFGLRNPWRFSFDPLTAGGTDAMVIADVGQVSWEEVDYEPAHTGGRNYGWRYREGANDHVTTIPPFSLPLTDPILQYDHSVGSSITGGFVYRGSKLHSHYRGRYFFGDFTAGRVWSLGLNINPATGEATGGGLEEHTAELGGSSTIGLISSFGTTAAGELLIVSYSKGSLFLIESAAAPNPKMFVDLPGAGPVAQPFAVAGWALDLGDLFGNGVDTVHVWAVPQNGPAVFLGASEGLSRPDVAAAFGARFGSSGFTVVADNLPAGPCQIIVYAHSTVSGQFSLASAVNVTVGLSDAQMAIETPLNGQTFPGKVTLTGWAIDPSGSSGTGIDLLHVWGISPTGTARFIGVPTYGMGRPDIAATYGQRFLQSGWSLTATDLEAGPWTFAVYAHSTATGTFRTARSVAVLITDGLKLVVEKPQPGDILIYPASSDLQGFALDLGAAAGVGVDAIHVWAVPASGDPAFFLGAATLGLDRPDVGQLFGAQFQSAGFKMTYNLPKGTYNLIVYAHRTRTQQFDAAVVLPVIVQ